MRGCQVEYNHLVSQKLNTLNLTLKLYKMIDLSIQNDILETQELVFGIIYVMTNTITGLKYVGQTVSHRKNKGKYRPFGAIGRFNDHVSEAVNNTKRKQCSYLNNAIRKHGKDSFAFEILEMCVCYDLNMREQFHIQHLNTMYPHGYNLTQGGKTTYTKSFADGELQTPKKHGGCVSRSAETRQKMSARAKQLATVEFRVMRSHQATQQHLDDKLCAVQRL